MKERSERPEDARTPSPSAAAVALARSTRATTSALVRRPRRGGCPLREVSPSAVPARRKRSRQTRPSSSVRHRRRRQQRRRASIARVGMGARLTGSDEGFGERGGGVRGRVGLRRRRVGRRSDAEREISLVGWRSEGRAGERCVGGRGRRGEGGRRDVRHATAECGRRGSAVCAGEGATGWRSGGGVEGGGGVGGFG